MNPVSEGVTIARRAASVWWRNLPALLLWASVGFILREGWYEVSVRLGHGNFVVANLAFALGMVSWIACLVLMVGSVRLPEDEARPWARQPSRWQVLVHAVVPFLVVFAVWGLADAEVAHVLKANYATHGAAGALNFSVTYVEWRLYLLMAAIGWPVAFVLGQVHRRRPSLTVSLAWLLARGLVLLSTFIGLARLAQEALTWLRGRRVAQWVGDAWHALVTALPDLSLPFGWTLPAVVADLPALAAGLLVGLFTLVALPLVWIALVASVRGWRGVDAAGDGDPAAAARNRLNALSRHAGLRRLDEAVASGPLGALRRYATGVAADYQPVWQGLRVVGRAGYGFAGGYLVLAAIVPWGLAVLAAALQGVAGPMTFAESLRVEPALDLAVWLVGWTIQVALFSAAFDLAAERLAAAASGSGTQDERLADAVDT